MYIRELSIRVNYNWYCQTLTESNIHKMYRKIINWSQLDAFCPYVKVYYQIDFALLTNLKSFLRTVKGHLSLVL